MKTTNCAYVCEIYTKFYKIVYCSFNQVKLLNTNIPFSCSIDTFLLKLLHEQCIQRILKYAVYQCFIDTSEVRIE